MKPLPPLDAIRVVLCLRRYGHKDVNAATAVMALQPPIFEIWFCFLFLNHRDIKDGGVCSNVRFSFVFTLTRVAEVAREQGWHPPKSLDSDENFKPEHTLFCRELRFVAIYALFLEIFGQKKCLFG